MCYNASLIKNLMTEILILYNITAVLNDIMQTDYVPIIARMK